MADDKRAERLLDLQKRFLDGARLTVDRMMSDYSADRRTVNRDLNTLMDGGLKLSGVRGQDNKKIWSLEARSRKIPVPFNLTDLTALFMGRRLFDFLSGTLLEESLEKVYDTIETRLDREKDLVRSKDLARKVYLISEGPKKLDARHVESLDEVLTGLLLHNVKVHIKYVTHAGHHTEHVILPYTLVAFRRGLYILCKKEETDETRIYAIERIKKAEALKGERFIVVPENETRC